LKFPPFDYLAASSVHQAVTLLASDEDAKVLAGGQSLLPLLALRLARPSTLVDITRLALRGAEVLEHSTYLPGPVLRIGALTRQRELVMDPVVGATTPLLAAAAGHVGHPATRNRGTLGGSLAHADPAAELPAVAVALGAVAVVSGPTGTRRILCSELGQGSFTTALSPDEILTEIYFPAAGGRAGAAFCEWAPRAGDFAEVGVGVAVELSADATAERVSAGACALGPVPLDLGPALVAAGVLGEDLASPSLLRAVGQAVTAAASPAGEDKAQLAGLLAARALRQAFDQARIKADGLR
jgi:aerobic carbon-monoxide dehydrogenase medium subunit